MREPAKASAGRERGLNRVFEGELSLLGLDILVLDPGDEFKLDTCGFEIAAVPLSGDSEVSVEGRSFRLARSGVFTAKASALCLPEGTEARFKARAQTQIALCRARTQDRGQLLFVPPEKVRVKSVGRDAWERTVVDIIGPDEPASRIVLGETFNRPGGWSSFPPHKHDTHVPGQEASMEEIYLFRLDPAGGFGTQTIYGEQGSFSFTVRDYDAVTIPWGYHPVAAMPGYGLYYLWFLAGEGRALLPNTDPDYKWLIEGK